MIYTYIDLVRGDDCLVPVKGIIPEGAEVLIHLRESADAISYYILSVVDNNVVIPSTVTINLQGHYEFDIECVIEGTSITIQHTDIDFIPDVTRTYGDIEPILDQDLERNKIIAKQYLVKDSEGNISSLGNSTYRHVQTTASNTWNILHNLGKYPSVAITDTAGTVVEGRITYVDANTVSAEFNFDFSGYANCN